MRDFLKDIEEGAAKSPELAAQENMRPKLVKRFYEKVAVAAKDDGYTVLLDDRTIKTPGKNLIILPNEAAAQLFADEWAVQGEEIDPLAMPVTRITNTAIDGISKDPQAVLEDVLKFASSDLLFYRADGPEELVELQRKHWDPILDWVEDTTGARFELGEGIIHVAQPKETISLFSNHLKTYLDPMKLCCLHTFTTLCGSALIALALAENHIDVETAWNAAHVDEHYNISKWGEDFEAQKRMQMRFNELEATHKLFSVL